MDDIEEAKRIVVEEHSKMRIEQTPDGIVHVVLDDIDEDSLMKATRKYSQMILKTSDGIIGRVYDLLTMPGRIEVARAATDFAEMVMERKKK